METWQNLLGFSGYVLGLTRDELASVQWADSIPTLMGALVGGLLTLHAANKTFKGQQTMQRQQLLDMEKAFLQSINSELAMVRQHYQTVIGNEIDQLPDGKPFESNYSVTGDYFTVYNKSDQIGHVRDEKLRRDIIWAYSMMKGLLDSYQTNNDMLAKREQDMKDFRYSSKMVGLLDANTRSAELTQYAETLKTYHLEARAAVDSALESIDETLKHEKNWKV